MAVNWYTAPEDDAEAIDRLTAAWEDAPVENLETLGFLLSLAKRQVIAYAPEQPEADMPDDYALAQLQQAKNLWNAGRVAGDGTVGAEGFSFTPRPLDRTIRTMIRPIDGKPDVY